MINQILNQSAADEFLHDFESYEISHVWRGAGTAIFLELGDLTQEQGKNPKGELSFLIEWSWRIENRNSILLGSFSEDHDISKAIDILKGKKIVKATFFGRLKELELELENDIWFLSFATAEGSPEWAAKNKAEEWLYFRKGKYVIEKNT